MLVLIWNSVGEPPLRNTDSLSHPDEIEPRNFMGRSIPQQRQSKLNSNQRTFSNFAIRKTESLGIQRLLFGGIFRQIPVPKGNQGSISFG